MLRSDGSERQLCPHIQGFQTIAFELDMSFVTIEGLSEFSRSAYIPAIVRYTRPDQTILKL